MVYDPNRILTKVVETETETKLAELENTVNTIIDETPQFEVLELIRKLEPYYRQVNELTAEARMKLAEIMKDPTKVPSKQDVDNAFPFYRFGYQNEIMQKTWQDLTSTNSEHPVFEVFTKEYIEQFAQFLETEISRILQNATPPIKILEVAAGDGRFSLHLRKRLEELGVNFELIATDTKEWENKGLSIPSKQVETQDHNTALTQHQPHIVICSWMPPDVDFTADFRKTESVQSYILIGPPHDCGTPQTWGVNESSIQEIKDRLTAQGYKLDNPEIQQAIRWQTVHVYDYSERQIELDGFNMTFAPSELREIQISKLKSIHNGELSTTVIFRRQ